MALTGAEVRGFLRSVGNLQAAIPPKKMSLTFPATEFVYPQEGGTL